MKRPLATGAAVLALLLLGLCQFARPHSAESVDASLPAFRRLETYPFASDRPPESRVALPPGATLRYLEELDERKYRAYLPGPSERAVIREGLQRLPPLHRDVLKRRVLAFYFIEDFASNGLADWVLGPDGALYCFLAFHPRSLRMSAREIIEQREMTNFIPDDSGLRIEIEAGGAESAWTYLALHELTHAIDYTMRVTPYTEPASRELQQRIAPTANLAAGYWQDYNRPREEYDFPLRAQLSFYGFGGGPKMPLARATELYQQLARTPFVSTYGAKIWAEDAAELVSMYHLTERLGYPYKIRVSAPGAAVYEYEPMKNPLVRARFDALQVFY